MWLPRCHHNHSIHLLRASPGSGLRLWQNTYKFAFPRDLLKKSAAGDTRVHSKLESFTAQREQWIHSVVVLLHCWRQNSCNRAMRLWLLRLANCVGVKCAWAPRFAAVITGVLPEDTRMRRRLSNSKTQLYLSISTQHRDVSRKGHLLSNPSPTSILIKSKSFASFVRSVVFWPWIRADRWFVPSHEKTFCACWYIWPICCTWWIFSTVFSWSMHDASIQRLWGCCIVVWLHRESPKDLAEHRIERRHWQLTEPILQNPILKKDRGRCRQPVDSRISHWMGYRSKISRNRKHLDKL